jgi:hypothetical protein
LSTGRNDHDHPGMPLPDPTSGERPALPFSDLVARFSLDRGMARAQSVELEVDDAAVTVAGMIDLLLWAADVTVEVAAPNHPDEPIALQIVGPLKRPQTRLTVPPALRAATEGP